MVQTTIMAGSEFGKSEEEGDAGNSLGRHNAIQWLDDDDDEI